MVDRVTSRQGVDVVPPPDTSQAPVPAGAWDGDSVRVEATDETTLDDTLTADGENADVDESEEKKEVWEREILESDEECEGEGVAAIEGAREYMNRLPEFNPRALGLFMAAVAERQHSGGHPRHESPEQLLRRATDMFQEPAHAFAALDAAARHLRATGQEDTADRLQAARDLLQAQAAPSIRAGLNIAVAAFDVAQGDGEEAARLRAGYREAVFGAPGPASVYAAILKQFGVETFPQRLAFLARAVGEDLASAGPSIPVPQLREILGALSELHVLAAVHDRCAEMVARLGRMDVAISVDAVMARLLPLASSPAPTAEVAAALPVQAGVPSTRFDAAIAFLRDARGMLAMMPLGVFRDADARFAVMRGVQDGLDTLIDREESAA